MIINSGTIFFDSDKNEYELIEFIGNGSFGDVYKIKSNKDNRFYALKTIQSPFVSENVFKSFINEGKIAQKISHPNVIKYFYFHDGSTHPELPLYIIMEYAKNKTLQNKIYQQISINEFFDNHTILNIFMQLCEGMEVINNELLHRDIKPDNILVDGEIFKIGDFGLSKIVTESTRTSTFKGIGCLPYMAPEGWKLETNTIQMDIYSMGLVFYEIACLRHPFIIKKGDYKEWQEAHFFQNPKSPGEINSNLSLHFSTTILKMIEKKASNRFNNWQQVKEALLKEKLPPSEDTSLINSIIEKKLIEKQKTNVAILEKEKKIAEIESLKQIVCFQLENEVINPIGNFLLELNNKSEGLNYSIKKGSHNLHYLISNFHSQVLKLEVEVLIEDNFWKEYQINDYGHPIIKKELKVPKLNNRKILAWGYVKANDGRGFNLILLESPNEIYGEWFSCFNSNSALVRAERLEPFAFNFNEIEKEIQITGMYIYVKSINKLYMKDVKKFIANYL